MKAKTIDKVEAELAQPSNLSNLLDAIQREGYRPRVELLDKKQRKKRKSAAAENWSPKAGDMIRIHFEPAGGEVAQPEAGPGGQVEMRQNEPAAGPRNELIRALDRAESQPGFRFVSLKWFRDTFLLKEASAWAVPSARQQVLGGAIESGIVLTSQVHNPKSPEFPVTAIRLNRVSPEVKAALEGAGASAADFAPVGIRGESLSATVLRERR